jgi:hypothetical protein
MDNLEARLQRLEGFVKVLLSKPGGSGGAVSSVFGRTGAVTAQNGDYAQANITGLTTADSPQFTAVNVGHASDTTITRSGAGAIQVEGVQVILSGAALGTPASGTLTNCSGLPAANVSAGTFVANMEASDHGTAATDMLVNVCYGTGSAPAANTTTEGTLFIKYTA